LYAKDARNSKALKMEETIVKIIFFLIVKMLVIRVETNVAKN
jgi:hypothetical protein